MGKKKKALAAKAKGPTGNPARDARLARKEERRVRKIERRKKEKKSYTADMWAAPAPSHLVAKLDVPRVKSKYQSYFEFADNPEKKQKKLEYQVTTERDPPPGFVLVNTGDPMLTNACKELSREKGAMIFIVSNWKGENSTISHHVHRIGYFFREVIVDEARQILGETVVSNPTKPYDYVEPIPDSQEQINQQADAAIRDFFPRIPNTDRQMIIEHAFKKGAMFHGEPTVGLQSNIPLSRRVQLAVLAHIRHTHTRYDLLLRETTWMNARKAVEPVCLDILVKWRGDEETGRDQMDEILREVVIITDSESEDDSSDEETSEEEGEVTSSSSPEAPSLPSSRNQQRLVDQNRHASSQAALRPSLVEPQASADVTSSNTRPKPVLKTQRDKKAQRGFKRYQAAWEEALSRRQEGTVLSPSRQVGTPYEDLATAKPGLTIASPFRSVVQYPPIHESSNNQHLDDRGRGQTRYHAESMGTTQTDTYYSQHRPAAPGLLIQRSEVTVNPNHERPVYYQDVPPRLDIPSYPIREQRPPQVVRRSPVRHSPQDIPVPSIESVSSDVASPYSYERHGVQDTFNHPQDGYSRRMIERRVQSPAPRQMVVINDDSPQIKRRRLLREDDSGYLRSLPSRDHSLYVAHSDSHSIPTSSTQPDDFLIQRTRAPSQSTQGLLRDNRPLFIDPATRLPVYDAPESSYFITHPARPMTVKDAHTSSQRPEEYSMRQMGSPQPPRNDTGESFYTRRPVVAMHNGRENLRVNERDRVGRQAELGYHPGTQMPPAPSSFPVSRKVSRPYDMSSSNGLDQNLIHRLPESQIGSSFSHPRDDFIVLPERDRNLISYGNVQSREDHPARSFVSVPLSRARSPVRYSERPSQYREDTRQPVFYEHEASLQLEHTTIDRQPTTLLQDRQPTAPGEAPMYVRNIEPRRQIIVLE